MFDLVSFIPRAVMQGIPLLYGSTGEILPYEIYVDGGQDILDFKQAYKALYDVKQLKGVSYAAQSFHLTMAQAVCDMVKKISRTTGIKTVALSGGVCQNITLMNLIYAQLADKFSVYINEKVPVNDGGISLGQAAVALAQYKKGLINL